MSDFTLYSYYRSSCSYRIRIALHLKGIAFDYVPVHLINEGGEQNTAEYKALNPKGEVPLLIHKQVAIGQSMAILQYLDDIHAQPRLFPENPLLKAQVIQFCENINSGIQPIQNLSVLQRLKGIHGASESQIKDWCQHWIHKGFVGLEKAAEKTAGTFCFGGEITAADLFLIPQVYNAVRYDVDMNQFPVLLRVAASAEKLDAFQKAHPSRQVDAPRVQ